ncbi:MAG: DNA polymerase III subunit beta [Bacteroidia bacterium]|nr:DNA polymerase III subunit beta [Bacteroidota bacterium]MBP9084389.1 DNA polymerase III subunit beta [Bacteroidia bacterium]MBK7388021.1 DNA polymerase III subunit beta [Bacteroidota bacterium]MBK7969052.1 DNA polymerase III subunit beta [Bacteroidota bacterium]MBK8413477.1 DNA polymerase III subunit beta [Bacteroidota bacterium]
MKFIVSSTLLLRHIQSVSGALNTNSPLPILENFLFEIDNEKLNVSASDLETTMTTSMEVTSKEKGLVAVPAKILLDTLKTFAEQPLTFTINDKNFQMEISSENGKFKLAGQDGAEFPKIPVIEQANSIEMPAEVLLEAINKTIFATGTDELRPVMSGVLFQMNIDNTTFVATDAHRLVRYRRTDIRSAKSASFIVPRKPLGLLKSALAGQKSKVKIDYNEANAFFTFDNFHLICRLIDGRYPNYEAVIPLDNPNKLTISRESFLNSIRRVSIFSNKTTHQVKLKLAGSEMTISAEDIDFNNEANERLSCDYNGQDMEIAFNARFLSDMLNNMGTNDINMELSLPNRAGILTPAGGDASPEENVLMLVMPVMLN